MVMFNCNRCSAALKKKDVENHGFKCGGRNNINVTCIDCLKDFTGNAYETHTSCVTEEQRYGGKNVVTKPTGQKQNKWIGIVREVLKQKSSLDFDVVSFLKSIRHMENIPRNRKKFKNWALSSKHIKNEQFLDKVFDILQSEFAKAQQAEDNKAEVTGSKKTTEKDNDKSQSSNEINDEVSTAKPKKSKTPTVSESEEVPKKKKKVDNGSNGTEEKEATDHIEPQEETNGHHEGEEKLSKKERKLLKKKAKYESEMREIENAKNEEAPETEEVEEVKKSKKSKKRKLAEVNGNVENSTENDKKRKVEKEVEKDNTDASPEDVVESPEKNKKKKFNWHENILQVLRSKDNEISVKKLTKKVLAEYMSQYGDKGIHEKLQSKLNKKLTTCPGVKVLKDRAKLLETEN